MSLLTITLVYSNAFIISVSVPPEHPTIYDEKRRDRSKTKIPWNEGSDVILSCEVPGGNVCVLLFLKHVVKLYSKAYTFGNIWIAQVLSNRINPNKPQNSSNIQTYVVFQYNK